MERALATLAALNRAEHEALRTVLVRATAVAGRTSSGPELPELVAAAPIAALPSAAALHRVAGTVRRGLEGVAAVPPEVHAELTALQRQSVLRHLLIASPLARINEAFTAAGVSWVVMKGPVVATLLYPEVGDRSYGDLDLLVDRRDFPVATRLLEELGYRHHIHNWVLAEQQMAGEISMSDDHVSIDLHWHLHYSRKDRRAFAIEPEAMIERHRLIDIAGTRTPTFDPIDTLLTLAFHAARSGGHRLIWLKDLQCSLAVERPDLDELVRRARLARCAPSVGLMLGRAQQVLGADIPSETVAMLTPRSLRAADRLVNAAVPPIQLHERPTVTRLVTRSVRSSLFATVAELPMRGASSLGRRLFPPAPNETDDRDEQQSYFAAVQASFST